MSASSLTISQKLCSTIDEFSVNVAGHNVLPLKIQPGAFNSYWSLVEANDFLLMIRQVEYQYFEAGNFKPDTYGFAFMSHNGSIMYNGRRYKQGEKLVTLGTELNSILSTNMRMVTCFLDDANLRKMFIPEEIAQFHHAIKVINHKTKRAKTDDKIALYLHDLIQGLSRNTFVIANDVIYQDLVEDIYLKLFNYVTDTHETFCSTIKPKYRLELLKKSMAYIHNNDIATMRISDISQHVHTSQRNLQKLFLQYLEVSPKTYLLTERLNKIYQDLLKADPKASNVRDISQRYGVIHQGNFAQDYFRFFGEYPKDTLKKKNKITIKTL